jgi:hypothetical protein
MLAWALAGLLALSPAPAWGYIDPGAGSMLVQSLLALVAAALVAARLGWRRLKGFFFRRKGDRTER